MDTGSARRTSSPSSAGASHTTVLHDGVAIQREPHHDAFASNDPSPREQPKPDPPPSGPIRAVV